MTKTLIWVLVGVLAATGVGVLAFMEFSPRSAPTMAAAAGSALSPAKGGAEPVSAANTSAGDAAIPTATVTAPAAVPVGLKANPTVDELIQNAAAYDDAAVSLSGAILTQCTAGCEFALSDDTGVISVQLEGKGKDRLLPVGKVGKTIAVQGVFRASPRPQIVIEDPNGWQFVK